MCSIVDYEMFLPHSPPVFSHSPPTSFLSDFTSLRLSPQLSRATGSCRQMQHNYNNTNYSSIINSSPTKTSPKRPCLVIRPNEEQCNNNSSDEASSSDPVSPTKLKKKVVFADDKGMSLTHIRVMTEPSNVPPLWSLKFLAEVTHGVTAEAEVQQDPWEVIFPQPASDYVSFRRKLDQHKVSLENVIVKEAEDQLIGTIKVQNLSFQKEVFVRSTTDNWQIYEDSFCTFVPNKIVAGPTYIVFDTFSFKINLPPKARRFEFCVCFKNEGKEYWDNNNGNNYVIVKKLIPPLNRLKHGDQKNGMNIIPRSTDASRTILETWSQFASWNHLENSAPYW